MIWSKRKKLLEELLADSLKGRIRYHVTRYGLGYSHTRTRAWITLDKQEVVSFSTIKWMIEHGELRTQLREISNVTNGRDPEQRKAFYLAHDQATTILHQKELFSREDFDTATEKYVNLSIEDALASMDGIIRALAMLDRRLGKRRLSQLEFKPTEAQIARDFYTLRCSAENINANQQAA